MCAGSFPKEQGAKGSSGQQLPTIYSQVALEEVAEHIPPSTDPPNTAQNAFPADADVWTSDQPQKAGFKLESSASQLVTRVFSSKFQFEIRESPRVLQEQFLFRRPPGTMRVEVGGVLSQY